MLAGERNQRGAETTVELVHEIIDNLLESLPDGVFLVTPDNVLQRATPMLCSMSGYPEGELRGRSIDTLLADLTPLERLWAQPPSGLKSVSELETNLFTAAGGKLPVSFTGTLITDREGAVSGALCILRDISERKWAYQAIRASHKELHQIFHSAAGGMRVISLDYEVLRANDKFVAMAGGSLADMVGRKCWETFPGDCCRTRRCPIELVRQGAAHLEMEVEKTRADGGSFPCYLTVTPYHGEAGELLGIIEDFRDISERRRTEAALQKSEEYFQDLVENSLAGLLILRHDQVVYCNPELERMFGKLPDAFHLVDFAGLHDNDREKVRLFLQRVGAGANRTLETDFRFFPFGQEGKRAAMKWVYCRGRRVEYQGSEALFLSVMDITRAKELENLVRIHDKMSSLGRVAAGIAHEIRNPLSGINIYLGTLKKIWQRQENLGMVEPILGQIEAASDRIEAVIRRVMDFSKPTEPRYTKTSINQPIDNAIRLCSSSLRKRAIRIVRDLAPDLPENYLDPHLIEQVLMNLINNASEAMARTSGDKVLRITSRFAYHRIRVTVSDSGPGIDPSLHDKIFDPFYTTKDDGTGIGLSLCHRIVADHAGSLGVAAGSLGGAEFTIDLPLDRRALPRPDSNQQSAP